MNYALDALWWRLTHPVVRDLASLLTAPALWQSPCELSRRSLLGDTGFRYLLALNDQPSQLPENLRASRLGHYAENLLVFWFQHAPHSQLLAHNLPIFDAQTGQQKGALDFVVKLNQTLYHIELTCKYYGNLQGLPEKMRGLNPSDTLLSKQNKLNTQLQLSGSPEAKEPLRQHHIDAQRLHRASIIRGCAFTHAGSLPCHQLYPVNAWQGRLIHTEKDWQDFHQEDRFYVLARHEYLSPARVKADQLCSLKEVQTVHHALVAHMKPRDDGFWHEQSRLMLPEKNACVE